MATAETLDFAKLLVPIPGDNPAGKSLRDDLSPNAAYYVLRDARTAARAAERSLMFESEDAPSDQVPDWRPILEGAPAVIAEQSKDLEVTSWLIEALTRAHGYAGLRDGFRLARELVERFWDHLYPLPDEEGVVTRVGPLAALNGIESDGVLITPIANVPITQGKGVRRLGVSNYQQAGDLDRLDDPDKRSQRIAQGAVGMHEFEEEVHDTPPAFFRDLLDDLSGCLDELDKLSAVLDQRCGKDSSGFALAPPTSAVRNALVACQDVVTHLTRDVLAVPGQPAAGEAAGEEAAAGGGAVGGAVGMPGKIQNREQAFRTLLQIADFFKRSEPHSPVAYQLEQAVRWGRMALPELLTELLPEDPVREPLLKLVGIRAKEGKEGSEAKSGS